MQHEADQYNHQGKEYQFAGFDELTQFLKSQYLYLFSRVRSPIPEIPQRVRSTTNPGGSGHVWARDRFCDIGHPGTVYIDPETGLSRVWVRATVYDNPALLQGDPTYIKSPEALPDIEKRRLLHGDWSVFVGQAFPELSARVHGCEPFEIPPAPLVEVHDEAETERALKIPNICLIGINNRNLATFEVTLQTTERLRPMIPNSITVVAESGIFNAGDVQRLARANVDAILVGEALVTSDDIAAKVRELSGSNVKTP